MPPGPSSAPDPARIRSVASTVTSGSLVDQEGLRSAVDQRLNSTAAALRVRVREAGAAAERLADLLDVMLGGGKRMRAAFAYWSWRAHGGEPSDTASLEAILDLGVALELFQAAALFHDDVIDHSLTRRNRPTAHVTLTADHAAFSGMGNGQDYGAAGAILLGDLALVAAGTRLSAALHRADHLEPDVPATVLALWDEMAVEVTAGQFLDVHAQALSWGDDPVADERRAREVILAKSARYSVELPLVLGAALSGAGPAQRQAIASFGRPLGEAFQLRDDLLGVFGDPATTGKPSGDDIREGKRTVLMARAAAAGSAVERALLQTVLSTADPTAAQVDHVRSILVSTGAANEIESLIAGLLEESLAKLRSAELLRPGADVLVDLAHATAARTA